MPSLPTSLIVVGLVVAWLVVLVPMVSRRREEVPENNEEGARFRVLRRDDGSRRRRPVLSRTAMMRLADDDDAGGHLRAGDEDSHTGDGDPRTGEGMAPVTDGAAAMEGAAPDDRDIEAPVADELGAQAQVSWTRPAGAEPPPVAAGSAARASTVAAGVSAPVSDAVASAVGRAIAGESDAERGGTDGEQTDGYVMSDGDNVAWRDADGARVGRPTRAHDEAPGGAGRPTRYATTAPEYGESAARYGEEAQFRRTPIRPGRGGFDPAAADRARAYRFRQRRRVASVLTLLMIAGVVVGAVGPSYGYVAGGAGGVLLVLYLAYLRRQVRIEDAIRQRREARLERARQIRPGYRPSVAEQVYAHRTGTIPEPGAAGEYHVKSHVRQPVSSGMYGAGAQDVGRYGEVLDLDDSDPAFDDLEYYRPAAYTRRAG